MGTNMATNPRDKDQIDLIIESITYSASASLGDCAPTERRQLLASVGIDRGNLPAGIKGTKLWLIELEGDFPSSNEVRAMYVTDNFLEVYVDVRPACIPIL